jgi:hypothetical protein
MNSLPITGRVSTLTSNTLPPYVHLWAGLYASGVWGQMSGGELSSSTLEHAQQIAAHESSRTTKLHDRTSDQVGLDETERIAIRRTDYQPSLNHQVSLAVQVAQ